MVMFLIMISADRQSDVERKPSLEAPAGLWDYSPSSNERFDFQIMLINIMTRASFEGERS